MAFLASRSCWYARRSFWSETWRQFHEVGYHSIFLVAGGMAFFSAVWIAHGAAQARKIIGDLAVVGPAFFQLLIRELGPTFAGILIAVRIGSLLAAELASMKVSEQLDAWKMSVGDPYQDLVVPRLLAGLVGIPCLMVVGTAVSALGSSLVATFIYGADGQAFLDPSYVGKGDLISFASKALGYGVGIPLAGCMSGWKATGGIEGVGAATARGVVWACLVVLATDGIFNGMLFLVGMG